jgi:thiol-disulfide isomerase/thioredoxin
MSAPRRRILVAGVGLAAMGLGLGWALRWQLHRPPDPAAERTPPVDPWSQRFDTPGGSELALATFRGRPLVLNFWATWCAPCVEEMPLLDRFAGEHRSAGWQVVGLALDEAEPVRKFLAHTPVSFAIGLASGRGVGLSRSLGNSQGALPFSVVFDGGGNAFARKLGALNWQELTAWAAQVR